MGPEPPCLGGDEEPSGLRRCWEGSVYSEMRIRLCRLCSKGVSEMIWLFEGTLPLSDTTRSSSTVFIRVSRNFGTIEDPEESDGKRSFAAVRSCCALSRIGYF